MRKVSCAIITASAISHAQGACGDVMHACSTVADDGESHHNAAVLDSDKSRTRTPSAQRLRVISEKTI
jgi:hypothetical protein